MWLLSAQWCSLPAMTSWLDKVKELAQAEPGVVERLARLQPARFPAGAVIFRPGDDTEWFPVVLSGRVDVYLTGRTGRDILLYSVSPGETCVQTTLGLLGQHAYAAEGVAATPVEAVIIPGTLFNELVGSSQAFRRYVFAALAGRLHLVVELLEKVAFVSIEARLAAVLLQRADASGVVRNTHQELATAIGSAREVVSRRLETLAGRGLLHLERGEVRIVDGTGLKTLASA